ncbi:MAG: primosomal protein N' [Lamprobacter sp.]|uniref:primosomal protein N' n=1 Tax=Lamprobacter sp. TaxID=3100796 RepID=UPI002B25FB17|nr:primosomal protein N' [Lamprobacter sp.]MEA3639176.1 primosomal protein N' [Lamprobacter sp.]
MAIVQVAVAAPLPEVFDYLPPPDVSDYDIGQRVVVPFGRSRRVGIIVGCRSESAIAPDRLKPIERCLDQAPLLSAADLALIRWAADYYRCPPGEALFSALPSRLRRPVPSSEQALKGWRPTAASDNGRLQQLSRAPRQAATLAALLTRPLGLDDAALRGQLGDCRAALKALEAKGLIERCPVSKPTDGPARPDPAADSMLIPRLNDEQQRAVETLNQASGFNCFLLDGVTGSGKTEVYIRLINSTLERGQQILVLVPEIGLTPQLAERFSHRISAESVVLHSGLAEREREIAWRRAACGQARLVLGTRSAIFTPLPELGLVIVDEEHDVSLKQQDGFRYSARDLAVRRGQMSQCPVLLGSATPSLETLRNAERGRYQHLQLHRRAGGAQAPRFLLADIRAQPLITGLSHALLTRMAEVIEAGNQVLLFLNRRGFAPVLTCHDCGWISVCQHCDARMTLHRGHGQLICHHCGDQRPLPVQCPYCESPDLRPLGQGTERVEDSLRQRFPGIPLARIDRDNTRRKGELERLLAAARDGAYPILLGTQMLAKGHHLPGVTLVGILDLDHGLYGSDFRATERMAQLLIQVAGRAGRAERPGTVLVQTRHPDHPLLIRLLRQGYSSFAAAALNERAEARLPPFSFQALLRADSRTEQLGFDFLRDARALALALEPGPVELWGPAPASMERRAGRFRAQLLLQCSQRGPLHALIDRLLPALRAHEGHRRLRWSIDIDPQESL